MGFATILAAAIGYLFMGIVALWIVAWGIQFIIDYLTGYRP